MRAVVQRVAEASVEVGGEDVGRIGQGLLALVGVARDDGAADAEYIADKVADLRVFEDADGRMNRSVRDVGGAVLLVSQFTLCGDARKGRRPSWDGAAPPETARTFYEDLARRLRDAGLRVETGRFQASMRVHLINDGPVTVLLDSRRTF
jgi:D-tyrosyl-tRNA(Tyr) deacylase